MPTNHGSIEFLKFPDPQHPGDRTHMIKKWLRDSWARRKITEIQSTLLPVRGDFTGNINATDIATGIYNLDGFSISFSGTGVRTFGNLIQFPGPYKVQLVIGGPAGAGGTLKYRRYLTGSSQWTSWT